MNLNFVFFLANELGETASFKGSSWLELDRFMLPQDGISDQKVSITFSTTEANGVLLWHGEPTYDRTSNKDYLSLEGKNKHNFKF